MTEENIELSDSEKEALNSYIANYGNNLPESKHNVHSFLHSVVLAQDTTRLGNVTEEELGQLENPIRAFKHLASFANEVMNKGELAKYFNAQSEIITSTSLSRKGTLINLAVTQSRKIADVSPQKKELSENQKRFQFKPKDKPSEEQES